jgi:V/A-type H+-transporting ATPase subunit D
VKYQFNKTSMQRMGRELAIRQKALPTLQAKEAALRLEVKKARDALKDLDEKLHELIHRHEDFAELWLEYPGLLKIDAADIDFRNIAGVRMPVLRDIQFEVRSYSLFGNRAWAPGATELLKELCVLSIQIRLTTRGIAALEYARKKTTQKVNLYEKVQIPEYEEAISRVKRYLEDTENLMLAAQKMVKERQA